MLRFSLRHDIAFLAVHADARLLAMLLLVVYTENYAADNDKYANDEYGIDYATAALCLELMAGSLLVLIAFLIG